MDHEYEQISDKIQRMIDDAIDSHDFKKLSKDISSTLDDALDQALTKGSKVLKKTFGDSSQADSYKNYRYQAPEEFRRQKEAPQESLPSLYKDLSTEQAHGGMLTVGGVILCAICGLSFTVRGILSALFFSHLSIGGMPALFAAGAVAIFIGSKKLSRIKRFKKYVRALGDKTYASVKQLAGFVEKTEPYVVEDLETMIDKGWFIEGHMDVLRQNLITSDETYDQYIQTTLNQEAREKARAAAEPVRSQETSRSQEPVVDEKVREILIKGEEYLRQIHALNDGIPDEVITGKIARMEEIVARIFDRARKHPEAASDLRKLMSYYLPMTIKLLSAYEDMDQQPVQGENIRTAKKEIEETLDTLNSAFEKLLDSIYKDTALDVSTDISVLETLLAQEGLGQDDFSV